MLQKIGCVLLFQKNFFFGLTFLNS
jgi:hypothetical protein